MTHPIADFAQAYCSKYAFHLVPLPPKTKRPLKKNWGVDVISDPAEARKYFELHPDWNMGVSLSQSRICSFDVDSIEAIEVLDAEFGWGLNELRAKFPTIQGKETGYRVMFRVPDGDSLTYQKLTWPSRDGTKNFTVFELRASDEGQQRQDVLPPSIHPDTGRAYVWLTKPNGHFPDPPDFLIQLWKNWEKLETQLRSACPWAKPEPVRQHKPPKPRVEGDISVIDEFNLANEIEACLLQYGYKRMGRRYLSPHSSTGLPGVNILDDNKCFIHHASDPLCSVDTGQPVGPFDLYLHFEHSGDIRSACRAAAKQLGLTQKPVPQHPIKPALPAYDVDSDTGEIVNYPEQQPAPAVVVPRHAAAQAYGLEINSKGEAFATVSNIVRVLQGDESLHRAIWFDEFLGRVMTIWRGKTPREWADVDDINLLIYLQESLGMPKLGKQTVSDAVQSVAYSDKRNEAKAYIESLKWDGVHRLDTFLHDMFGTDNTEYNRCAGRNFWVSMVARVIKPGCKVDTMLVLEGLQGAGKSRALSIIGGQWFAEAHQSPTDKDFYMNLSGKMLIEIGEMDAFSRAEVNKVKQVITCQTDRFRAPYERRAADHPRRCVFAGTTNRDDWNKDETGARRFWPVLCVRIDHDGLARYRDQFFAEAAARLSDGAFWWEMPEDETKAQQEARRDSDALEDAIAEWLVGRSETTLQGIMGDLLKLPLDKQDKAIQMRISKALRSVGWARLGHKVSRAGHQVRVWRRSGDVAEEEKCPFSE